MIMVSMPFNRKPFQVTNMKGDMITVRNDEHMVTRNVFFFKYLPNYKKLEEEQNDDEEEDYYDSWVAGAQQPVPV